MQQRAQSQSSILQKFVVPIDFIESWALLQARTEEVHEGCEERKPNSCNHFAGIYFKLCLQNISIKPIACLISVRQAVCGQQMLRLE